MKNETQLSFVKRQLLSTGHISRNECLRQHITRAGAIILDLKKQGFKISGEYYKTQFGLDYVYKLLGSEFVEPAKNIKRTPIEELNFILSKKKTKLFGSKKALECIKLVQSIKLSTPESQVVEIVDRALLLARSIK